MPARPLVLDEIEAKMKGAAQVDLMTPVCAVASCRKMAVGLVALRFPNGSTDVYGVCPGHRNELKSRHPSKLDHELKQGVFLYAGY